MTGPGTAGLSFRAAARRVGATHKAISDAVAAGRIPLLEGGTVSAEAVDKWNSSRRAKRGGKTRLQLAAEAGSQRKVSTSDGDAPPARAAIVPPIDLAALAQTLAAGGLFADRASAELARDSFMARLRQLEFEERSGKLLDADRVTASIAAACAQIRTRLLAMPSERAASVARLKTAQEVQDALMTSVTEVLEDLAAHFAGMMAR